MEPIRVMLADPQTLFREGLKALFASCDSAAVVGEAACPEEVMNSSAAVSPDVVLMEVAGGVCQTIRSAPRGPRVAFLTARQDATAILEYQASGATGYLLKDTCFDELLTAIESIHGGGTWISAVIERKMRPNGMERRQPALTGREKEVLKMTAEGRSVKEVAMILDLSAKTVDAHKVNLMRKLRIHNKAQLVHYAFENRFIQL